MTGPRIPTDEKGNPNVPPVMTHCVVTRDQVQELVALKDGFKTAYEELNKRATEEWAAFTEQHRIKMEKAMTDLVRAVGLDPDTIGNLSDLQVATEFLESTGIAFLEYPLPPEGKLDSVEAQPGDSVN
jgi:hypothetical protein